MTARRLGPAAALLAVAAGLVFANGQTGDYDATGTPPPGRAGPGLDALADGDPGRFLEVQSLMGLGSIVLRLPVVLAAREAGAGDTLTYQLGALACLLGPVALGAWLYGAMRRRGAGAPARWIVAGLCVVNPFTWHGLTSGHPEEALAAALAVGAVLAAREHPLWSGLLGGLAAGTKQWALVALPVAVVAATRRRWALGAVAVGVAALLLLPGPLGDPDRAAFVRYYAGNLGTANELNAWWPVSNVTASLGWDALGTTYGVLPAGLERDQVAGLVPLAALVLALLFARRRRGDPADPALEPALALLALVLLARCALDPSNLQYYEVAPFLALLAWESGARPGVPRISIAVAVAYGLVFELLYTRLDPSLTALGYVAVTVPLAYVLALAAFAPGRVGSDP